MANENTKKANWSNPDTMYRSDALKHIDEMHTYWSEAAHTYEGKYSKGVAIGQALAYQSMHAYIKGINSDN